MSGYTNIRVNVWGPDQLFQASTFPALDVILQGPAVAGCGSPSGGSEVQVTFNTTGQGADKVYTLPLSSFTLDGRLQRRDDGGAGAGEHCAGQHPVLAPTSSTSRTTVRAATRNGLNVGSIKFN